MGKWARGAGEVVEVTKGAEMGLLSSGEEIETGGLMTAGTWDCGTKLVVERFPARHSECC